MLVAGLALLSWVCLRRIARTIMRCARRPLEFTARFGGEEFAVVLGSLPPLAEEVVGNQPLAAMVKAEKLRAGHEKHPPAPHP